MAEREALKGLEAVVRRRGCDAGSARVRAWRAKRTAGRTIVAEWICRRGSRRAAFAIVVAAVGRVVVTAVLPSKTVDAVFGARTVERSGELGVFLRSLARVREAVRVEVEGVRDLRERGSACRSNAGIGKRSTHLGHGTQHLAKGFFLLGHLVTQVLGNDAAVCNDGRKRIVAREVRLVARAIRLTDLRCLRRRSRVCIGLCARL